MIHRIIVEDQSLRWYGRPPKIADNSIEFVQFQFHLPEEWASLLIVVQFTQSETYNMLMPDDRCFLPVELKAGLCQVSLFGYSEGKPVRATSIPLVFQIEESGFVSSAETPIPPTPDLYAQLIEYFSSIAGSGGGGSGSGTLNPEDIAAAVEDYLSKNPPEPGAPGEPGEPGEDGGYYTPTVAQPSSDTIEFAFSPSKPDMPSVDPVQVKLPVGQGSGGKADFVVQDTAPEDTSVLWVDPDDNDDDSVVAITGATVGQTVKISEVDENGVPTAWEPVDFPEGGGGGIDFENLPLLYDVTTTEEVRWIDTGDNAFCAKSMIVMQIETVFTTTNENNTELVASAYTPTKKPRQAYSNYLLFMNGDAKQVISKQYNFVCRSIGFRHGKDGGWSIFSSASTVNNNKFATVALSKCLVSEDFTGCIVGDASALTGTRVLGIGTRLRVWGY